ncbi:MAG TPA: tetratricopeptide repeat protein [Candidatus Polarisedimenticolaceae bacterium]|nr:tetratricopeptide repeat protein [Candidatus Polarisedimenticolaceae bacterium]
MPRARTLATIFAAVTHTAYAIVAWMTDPLAVHLMHDAARYDAWAKAIVAGQVFEPGPFSQAPVYPYLLAEAYRLFGASPFAMILLQVALGVTSVWLVGKAAARAFGEEAGAWAAWLLAGCGVLAFFETKLLPTALVVCLVAVVIVLVQRADASDRPRTWIPAGVALGVLVVANAASLLLLAATIAWIAFGRQRVVRAALCLGCAALLILPVAIHNRRASGSWILVTDNGGVTFWQGNNPVATGVYSTPEGFSGAIAAQRAESAALASAAEGRDLGAAEVSSHWLREGVKFLASDIPHAAWLVGRKALLAVASTEQPLEYSPRLDANPLRFVVLVPFAVLIALAVAGIGPAWRQRAAHPALLTIGTTFATLLIFFVASRYRMPMVPALAIVGGAGAVALRRRAPAAIVTAVCIASLSFLWFPLSERALARAQDAMSLSDLGTALRETGRLDDAVATYRRAISMAPDTPYSHLDLGKAMARAGRFDEAAAETREAIRLAPEIGEAHFDLGVLQFRANDLQGAAQSFGEAFRLSPTDADAGDNLAGTLLKLGRAEEARAIVLQMRTRGLAVDPPLLRLVGK